MVEHMYDHERDRTTSRATPTMRLQTRTSTGLDMVQWRLGRSFVVHSADRRLLEAPLVDVGPVRVGGQWQNRPNQHGMYFWARTGQHVWYESALEASCLIALDFDGEVERIASQPFRLLFRLGARSVRHDPDFFAVYGNGDQVVYDVKPSARMTREVRDQFDETARVCWLVGWRHVVLHEPDPTSMTNLAFLRNARHARCHPHPALREQIANVFAAGRTIGEGREMVNRRSPALAMPLIKHLIWHRRLLADLTQRLDFDTVATTNTEDRPCCD